jgi:hypothetical protein
MSKCQYRNYRPLGDYSEPCKEQKIKDSNFCIFHDKKYCIERYQEFEDKARIRLEAKIRSLSGNKELQCIGYQLPEMDFSGQFDGPVNFSKCHFLGNANFSMTTFNKEANFKEATFESQFMENGKFARTLSYLFSCPP